MTTAAWPLAAARWWAAPLLPVQLLARLTPSEGWGTVALLLLSLLAVVWAVDRAAWAATPPLEAVALLGVLAGLAAAKARGPALLRHGAAWLAGAAAVYWLTAASTGAPGLAGPFAEVNRRLALWWGAATGGGISTDTLVFAIALEGFAWSMSYLSAWAIFRHRSLWGGLLPGALAHLTNLSYLPDRFLPYLYLYLFFAVLLAVRIHSLEATARWRRQGTRFPTSFGAEATYHGLWVAGAALLAVMLLPLRPVALPSWRDAWSQARSPLDRIEVHMARLFSGLPARKPSPYRTFGAYLPFQGAISLGDQPLFLVDAPGESYWRIMTYAVYTSQGWIAGEVESLPPGWGHVAGVVQQVAEAGELRYTVTPLFQARGVPVTAAPREAATGLEFHVLSPRTYWLPLAADGSSSADLPQDLRESLGSLRLVQAIGALGRSPEAWAVRALPWDAAVTGIVYRTDGPGQAGEVRTVRVEPGPPQEHLAALREGFGQVTGPLVGLWVARRPPLPPDVLGVTTSPRAETGQAYTLVSRPPRPAPEALRAAGTAYPAWVTDTYLQLPDSLPERVRDLALSITAGAETPYDRVLAIRSYLRRLPYTQDVPAPPFDADGVDHFLFTLRRGYSDYFGSAMVVLLRAAGVPSRMVAGYGPGEWDEGVGSFVVRDRDSHGWAEAYFPGHGWVEFEPTPGRHSPTEPVAPEEGLDLLLGSGGADEEELLEDLLIGGSTSVRPPQGSGTAALPGAAVAGLLAAAGAAVAWLLLGGGRGASAGPEQIFQRAVALGGLAGVGYASSQTPIEYASALARVAPDAGGELHYIGEAYARLRYSGRPLGPGEAQRLRRAWRRARRGLLRRALRRLLPV